MALGVALLAGCSSGSSSATAPGAAVGGSADTGAASPGTSTSASGFDGAALPGGVQIPGFTLSDQHGSRVSLSAYRGQVVLVAFPYTTCGGSCTVIAEQIRGALDELGKPVPVLMISADPQADTRARVGGFLTKTGLSGRVRYLSGPPARLKAVWRAFHVVPASAGSSAFDRSASVFLLDGKGRERVIFQLEQLTPEGLAHDVRRLLGGG